MVVLLVSLFSLLGLIVIPPRDLPGPVGPAPGRAPTRPAPTRPALARPALAQQVQPGHAEQVNRNDKMLLYVIYKSWQVKQAHWKMNW